MNSAHVPVLESRSPGTFRDAITEDQERLIVRTVLDSSSTVTRSSLDPTQQQQENQPDSNCPVNPPTRVEPIPSASDATPTATSVSRSTTAAASRWTTFSVADPALGVFRRHTVRKQGSVCWHQCSHCTKEFKKPSDLVRHIRIHTRVRFGLDMQYVFELLIVSPSSSLFFSFPPFGCLIGAAFQVRAMFAEFRCQEHSGSASQDSHGLQGIPLRRLRQALLHFRIVEG